MIQVEKTIRFFIYFIAVFLLLMASRVFAQTSKFHKITDIKIQKNGSAFFVDLVFDKPFSSKTLKPQSERNFIQFVFKNTKVDKARILNADAGEIEGSLAKIFLYPYSQDLTRLRLIFNTNDLPKIKPSFYNISNRVVRFIVKDVNSMVSLNTTKSATNKDIVQTTTKDVVKTTQTENTQTIQEKELLKEVVENTKPVDLKNPIPKQEQEATEQKNIAQVSAVSKTATNASTTESLDRKSQASESSINKIGNKQEPSRNFFRMIIGLFLVCGLFVSVIFIFKKYFNQNALPFGKKERIIQIVATHHIGQKKSISLIKVASEYLVVGVGTEGVSLITRLGPEANVEKYLEERFWNGTFEKHLDSFAKDKEIKKEIKISSEKIETKEPLTALLEKVGTEKVELSSKKYQLKDKLSKLKTI
jgi:flagellar biogenesis protein FliO